MDPTVESAAGGVGSSADAPPGVDEMGPVQAENRLIGGPVSPPRSFLGGTLLALLFHSCFVLPPPIR
jgi:hypothetical protein